MSLDRTRIAHATCDVCNKSAGTRIVKAVTGTRTETDEPWAVRAEAEYRSDYDRSMREWEFEERYLFQIVPDGESWPNLCKSCSLIALRAMRRAITQTIAELERPAVKKRKRRARAQPVRAIHLTDTVL